MYNNPSPNSQKHPTIVAIFDKLYRASVPTLMLQTLEQQQAFGVRMSGDPRIDKAMRSERTYTYMSIARMAEYFNDGVSVGLANPEDSKEIYDAVVDHLTAWSEHVKRAVHIHKAPLQDLIALDTFAHSVYKHARYYQGNEWLYNPLAQNVGDDALRSLMGSMQMGGLSMTNHRTEFERTSHEHSFIPSEAEHETLADLFKKAVIRPRQ